MLRIVQAMPKSGLAFDMSTFYNVV